MIDPISFAAGQGSVNMTGVPQEVLDAQEVAIAHMGRANNLQAEINNRWIPYAVTLRASLVARRVERQVLIDELKRLDPANAEQIIDRAEQARSAEYATMKVPGAKINEVRQTVMTESEEERLDR